MSGDSTPSKARTGELELRVLGACGSYSGPGGACSGYLVTGGDAAVWLEAGSGTLAVLQEHLDLRNLDAVVLTHEHADHWYDLALLHTALVYYIETTGLPVYTNAAVRAAAEQMIGAAEIDECFRWTVVDANSTVDIGGQRWTFADTEHYVPTLATRVDVGERSMSFSADTGPGWRLKELGTPNLAVVESTYAHRTEENLLHLCASEAGAMAAEAGADQLVLTHLAPGEDPELHVREAATEFHGPISVAAIGSVYSA